MYMDWEAFFIFKIICCTVVDSSFFSLVMRMSYSPLVYLSFYLIKVSLSIKHSNLFNCLYIELLALSVFIRFGLSMSDFRSHEKRSPVTDVGHCNSQSTETGLCV